MMWLTTKERMHATRGMEKMVWPAFLRVQGTMKSWSEAAAMAARAPATCSSNIARAPRVVSKEGIWKAGLPGGVLLRDALQELAGGLHLVIELGQDRFFDCHSKSPV